MNRFAKKIVASAAPLWWEVRGAIDFLAMRRAMRPEPVRGPSGSSQKMRVAFVCAWYGPNVSGGAEAECWGLVHGLKNRDNGITVEVFTTTLHEFAADWNRPVHPLGSRIEEGVTVHRFHPTCPDRRLFHILNGTQLMSGGTETLKRDHSSPLSDFAEAYYLRHMLFSEGLFARLRSVIDQFDFFIYIPYMFAPTAIGGHITHNKSIIIPCLHDERYAYMNVYRSLLKVARASLYHVPSELALAQTICEQRVHNPILIGEQVDTRVPPGDSERFRNATGIADPFILYAGRQIVGKNLPRLVECFKAYKKRHSDALKLVLIGKGDLDYSGDVAIINLGFVSPELKQDAYKAALALVQPSLNESFSIVMMEAWLQKTPVLAHSDCAVTRDHCVDSKGGLTFASQDDFDTALSVFVRDEVQRRQMGENGCQYVRQNYSSEVVLTKLEQTLWNLKTD